MQLDFFPSRTLTIYLAKLFVVRILAVLVMLVVVLQMLDLLGESGKILAFPGNGEAQLWTYISLRAPQLIARFLPYSVLLATIITLATLNQNSEVISMKAAGMSAHQVLAPLFLAAGVVSLVSFVFNERVVARATSTLSAWTAVDYGQIPANSGVRNNVYVRDGRNVLLIGTVTGAEAQPRLEKVTWYKRDAAGMVTEEISGPRAVWANPGWRLDKPVRFTVKTTAYEVIAPLVIATGVTPRQVAISSVNADGQNVFELRRSIQAMEEDGRRTSEIKGKWWHKFSGPLAALLMPLLGAVAAFGLARSGQLLIRSIIGMALGFTYFVIDNAALALGNFGGYPPFIAAWAPFFLFLMIGEAVLIRTEE